jgi:hypothetical protein
MKQHEREFFIYRIRSGVIIQDNITINPPTIKDKALSTEKYIAAYNEAISDGMMTEDEVDAWMISQGLWSEEEQQKLSQAEKDVEKLKIEMYNNHANDTFVDRIRKYLRAAETFRDKQYAAKSEYSQNTVEGIARSEEMISLLKSTTLIDNKPILLDNNPDIISTISYLYFQDILTEKQIRELARNNPWSSLWAIKDQVDIKLFDISGSQELTVNQHALLMWSQTYDNIQESVDCPTPEVIEDDDILDGWFLTQAKKRRQQKAENDFESNTKSDKIKGAGEVFVMSKGKKDDERINSMNSVHGQTIKKQRFSKIKKHGSAKQGDFADEKMKLQTMSNNKFRDAVKRR